MSKVADFYVKAIADEEAKKKLAEVLDGKNFDKLTDAQLKEVGDIAKDLGFDITLDEAKEYLKSIEDELSDDALQAVAGGGNITTVNCKGSNSYVTK